jgi:hypothetical protein
MMKELEYPNAGGAYVRLKNGTLVREGEQPQPAPEPQPETEPPAADEDED